MRGGDRKGQDAWRVLRGQQAERCRSGAACSALARQLTFKGLAVPLLPCTSAAGLRLAHAPCPKPTRPQSLPFRSPAFPCPDRSPIDVSTCSALCFLLANPLLLPSLLSLTC